MDILAGAFVERQGATIPEEVRALLSQHVSRRPADRRHVIEREGIYLVAIGDGARRGHLADWASTDVASVTVGQPYATGADETAWPDGWLEKSVGTFCGATVDARHRRLAIYTDKLGVRQMYYGRTASGLVLFASALGILERTGLLPLTLDVTGVLELAAFGYPLGSRTPYRNVKCLGAAEVVSFSADGETSRTYWSWDRIGPDTARPVEAALRDCHQAFQAAVTRRLEDPAAEQDAFLSGGLDSRVVVAALRSHGTPVRTATYGVPGSADFTFGPMIADALGTRHRLLEFPRTSEMRWGGLAADAFRAERTTADWLEIWAGDGGSVGMGHVYLSPAAVQAMRAGSVERAAEIYCADQSIGIPTRVIRASRRAEAAALAREGIVAELKRFRCADPGRAFFLFLMQNDQRRHMAAVLEDLDLHRVHFILPFFDADVVEAVLRAPLDDCLRHRFYHRWLREFQEPVWKTPWQAYPGHEPCPIPGAESVTAQWDLTTIEAARHDAALRSLRKALRAPSFPSHVLSRSRVRLLYWFMRAGGRRYDYVAATVNSIMSHWHEANARQPLGAAGH